MDVREQPVVAGSGRLVEFDHRQVLAAAEVRHVKRQPRFLVARSELDG